MYGERVDEGEATSQTRTTHNLEHRDDTSDLNSPGNLPTSDCPVVYSFHIYGENGTTTSAPVTILALLLPGTKRHLQCVSAWH